MSKDNPERQPLPDVLELLEKIDTITQRDDLSVEDGEKLERYYDELINNGNILWHQKRCLDRLIKKYLEERE